MQPDDLEAAARRAAAEVMLPELVDGFVRAHGSRRALELAEGYAAAKLAKEAIVAAEAHANEQWKEAALSAVEGLARAYAVFTADSVWHWLSVTPDVATHEPRALGAIMQAAAKAGYVRATDRYAPSIRARCHGRPVRVWESRIYDPFGRVQGKEKTA